MTASRAARQVIHWGFRVAWLISGFAAAGRMGGVWCAFMLVACIAVAYVTGRSDVAHERNDV